MEDVRLQDSWDNTHCERGFRDVSAELRRQG